MRLAKEPLEQRGVASESPDQNLQRDLVAGLGMYGPIDRAHPAAPQRFEDAVTPDPQVGHGVARRLSSRSRLFHYVARSSSSPRSWLAGESSSLIDHTTSIEPVPPPDQTGDAWRRFEECFGHRASNAVNGFGDDEYGRRVPEWLLFELARRGRVWRPARPIGRHDCTAQGGDCDSPSRDDRRAPLGLKFRTFLRGDGTNPALVTRSIKGPGDSTHRRQRRRHQWNKEMRPPRSKRPRVRHPRPFPIGRLGSFLVRSSRRRTLGQVVSCRYR